MEPQQGFHAVPEYGVAAAGFVQEGGALGRVLVESCQKDGLFVHGPIAFPTKGGDRSPVRQSAFSGEITPKIFCQEVGLSGASVPISRRSHTRAKAQSRSAV